MGYRNFAAILRLLERYYTLSYSPDIPALLQSYEDLVGSRLTDDAHHFMMYFLTWYDQRLINGDRVSFAQIEWSEEEIRIRDWAKEFLARHNVSDRSECLYLCRIMRQQAVISVLRKMRSMVACISLPSIWSIALLLCPGWTSRRIERAWWTD